MISPVVYLFFYNPVISVITILVLLILFFYFFRWIFCWYLKINDIIKNQSLILKKIEKIEEHLLLKRSKENDKDSSIIKDLDTNKILKQNLNFGKIEDLDEETIIKDIFKKCKNIAVYETGNNLQSQNIYTYFKAKQYTIILIGREIEKFKTYETIVSIEEDVDLVVFMEMNKDINELKEKLNLLIKECIARKKVKKDILYIWVENYIEDFDKSFPLDLLYNAGIVIINNKNFYKEYVKTILSK
jgi:predicted CoA-binding protein